jgi:FAD/FMN-containing dehydrogenase
METRRIDWDILRRSLHGDVVLPADAGYDVARQLQDIQFDAVRPRAVAYCANPADVQATLRFARRHDVHVAVRSGGHSTAGYSTTTGLVLDVSRLNSVSVRNRIVRMGPGAQAVDAANALAPHGLAVPNGFCPTVSAGGFFAGGGIGLLTRSAGVGSDRLRAAEVVLADGRIVRCSADREPDLFWALRGGGGGNFGVVTRYHIDPVRISRVVNFSLVWSWDSAADLVSGWQRWAPTAPDGLTSWLGIFLPDASPGSVAQVVVFGMWQGQVADLDPQLAALTGAVPSPPLVRSVDELPYQTAMMQWWFCGDKTVDQCHRAGYGQGVLPRTPYQTLRGRMFERPMPRSAVEQFLAAFDADRRPGQTRISLSAALAGQVNRVGRTDTAYVHRTSQFHLDYTVTLNSPAPTDDDLAAAARWATNGFRTIDRYSNHESYQNYTDPRLRDWPAAYYAENYHRLKRAKRHYDPDNFFRFEQSIGRRSGPRDADGHDGRDGDVGAETATAVQA